MFMECQKLLSEFRLSIKPRTLQEIYVRPVAYYRINIWCLTERKMKNFMGTKKERTSSKLYVDVGLAQSNRSMSHDSAECNTDHYLDSSKE